MAFFAITCFAQEPEVINVTEEEVTEEVTFVIVEVMPKFPGGEQELFQFLASNLKYPEDAIHKGVEGVVYVTFVIGKDGSVQDARVLRGIGGGCDEEALRVVNLMPTWSPGIQRGKAVRTQYNLPIKFTLGRPGKSRKGKIPAKGRSITTASP